MTGPRGGRPSWAQLEQRQRSGVEAPAKEDPRPRVPHQERSAARTITRWVAQATELLPAITPATTPAMRPVLERAHDLAAERLAELPPGATCAMRAACAHAALYQAFAAHLAGVAAEVDDPGTVAASLSASQRAAKSAAQHDAALVAHRREAIGTSAAQSVDLGSLLMSGSPGRRTIETSGDEQMDPVQ